MTLIFWWKKPGTHGSPHGMRGLTSVVCVELQLY
jgi:hypothetical protein